MGIKDYTALKVFTATKANDRETLGEKVTAWLSANRGVEVVETAIQQSSDNAFHCLSVLVFYRPRTEAQVQAA